MPPHYIQSELFRELVGLETLLKPEYQLSINKLSTGNIDVYLWKTFPTLIRNKEIDTRAIKNYDQITAEINRIWQAIPAECKRITLEKS